MTELCLKIKRLILRRISNPDEIYSLYEKDNFEEMIKGLAEALYEILTKDSRDLLIQILQIFRNIAHHDNDYARLNSCHQELKRLLERINDIRKNNPSFAENFKDIITNIENTIQILIQRKKTFILPMIKIIIEKRRDLNIITALIRDNKDILEIKGENNHNLLWILLEKYSKLPANKKEEINYLYQVILLFISSEELEHSIYSNKKYYLSALKNRGLAHVREIIKILERKQKISVGKLEARYGINTRPPQTYWHDQENYCLSKDGGKIYDFSKLPTCSVDTEGAVCLDDAFSLVKNKDGSYTLYRHTVFIPQMVPYASTLNINSINQIKTLYLKGDTRNLYPPAINFASSLRQGKIRHVETSIWRIKPDFTLEEGSYQLVRSIIKNDHQLSFEQAARILHQNGDDPLTKILIKSNKIANQLETGTFPKYSCCSSKSFQTEDKPIINTIRNFGVLNTLSRMDLISERDIPYIYVASDKVRSLDFDGPFFRSFTGDLRQFPEHIGGFEYFTTTPRKHYGLGFRVYGQVGSPLRISVAGQIQYLERDLVLNPNPSDEQFRFWQEQTKKLVNHYNKNTSAFDAFVETHNQLERNNRLVKRR